MAENEEISLKTKLQNILNEKGTKLIPENIKNGTTILGVTGAYGGDATATSSDVLNPKTFYNADGKQVGSIIPLERNDSLPNYPYVGINNNTGYNVLDINYDVKLALVKVNNTSFRLCKIVSDEIVTDDSVLYTTNSLVTVENKNKLMDVKFMYTDNINSINIAGVVYTNYHVSREESSYVGFILTIDTNTLDTLELITRTQTIHTDSDEPNNGIVSPRPNRSDCFAYYGHYHCVNEHYVLIRYYINGEGTFASSSILESYRTDASNTHGITRFCKWSDNGNYFYCSDNTLGYFIYLVNNDNVFTSVASDMVLLNDTYAMKNGTNVYNIATSQQVGTSDISITNETTDWACLNNFILIIQDNKLNVYSLDGNVTFRHTFSLLVTSLMQSINYLFTVSNMSIDLINVYDIEKTLYGLIRNHISYYSGDDATSTANDILATKTAYISTGKVTGSMPNNGALSYNPSISQQTIPAGYTSGGTINAVTSAIDSNIIAENIKSGITVLGVTGTYDNGVAEALGGEY